MAGRREHPSLNGEQVQKLLSFRRFVRAAGFGAPRELVAGVQRRLALEASQTFDEDGLTTSAAAAAAGSRRDNARKRYGVALWVARQTLCREVGGSSTARGRQCSPKDGV